MKLKRFFAALLVLVLSIGCLPAPVRAAAVKAPVISISNILASGCNRLTWDPVENGKYYRIYRSATKSGGYSKLKTTSSLSYTDKAAAPGETWYYLIKTVSTDGSVSASSSKVSSTAKLPRPEVTLRNVSSTGRIKVSWDKIDGASSYRVYRSADKKDWDLLKKTTSTGYTDTTAKAGQKYYYKVMAVLGSNTAGNSAYSAVVSGTYTEPKGLTLKAATNDAGQPYLTWNAVKGAAKYRVYRSYREKAGFSLLSTRTVLYYTNSSAPKGANLYYYIKALDADGNVLETSETRMLYLEPEETLKNRYVAESSARIYSAPTTAASFVTLDYMAEVKLGCKVTGSWYRVFHERKLYYIYGTDKLTSVQNTDSYTGSTALQQEVLDLAMDIHRNWNTVYATGQSTGKPNADGTYGFNAPGLVKYILNTVMEKQVPVYQLSLALDTLYATETLFNRGYPGETNVLDLTMEEIQPGDVLFFGTSAKPSYCGLYLGNGDFIYATGSEADGICVMPLDSYLGKLMAVRRYLPETVTPANTRKSVIGDYKTYKLYESKSSSATVIKTLRLYDPVTVLFTDSGSWAYVETEEGIRGFMMANYLGDYEYLDHAALEGALNEEGKPSFTWNSVRNAAVYEIYRSLRADRGFELIGSTENTYYSNLTVPGGLTFYYRLRVLDAAGCEIDVSNTVALTTELEGTETLRKQYVHLPVINLYQLPDTDSEPLTLRYREEVQLGLPVIDRVDGSWYRVYHQGQLMYLWSSDITESLMDSRNSLSSYVGNTDYQQQVIDLALEISEEWKTVYAHEQSDGIPNADGSCGFDCSGLTAYIFNRVMQPQVPTYRMYGALETQYATTVMYNQGYPGEFSATDVAPGDLQPGDILFFTSLADGTASTEIGHCGIYLGNNEFVHSTSSWEDAVCIMGLTGSYLENYAGARRYLPEKAVPANKVMTIDGPYRNYKVYAEKNSASAVIATPAQADTLTVLFTDGANWAMVRTADGVEGYFLTKYLA